MSVPKNDRTRSQLEVFNAMQWTVREIFHCAAAEDVFPRKTRWQFANEFCKHAMNSYLLLSESTDPTIRDLSTVEQIQEYERKCIDEWYTLLQLFEIYSGMYPQFTDRYYKLVQYCAQVYHLLIEFFFGKEYDEKLLELDEIPVMKPLPILNGYNLSNNWGMK